MDCLLHRPNLDEATLSYRKRIAKIYIFDSAECLITKFGNTDLHIMAKVNEARAIMCFLSSFSTADIVDVESGATPLVAACYKGSYAAAQTLIELGADVNHKCSGINSLRLMYSDITPLHVAACADRYEIIDLLLKNGAEVNQKCIPQGYTPLHRAVQNCNLKALDSLLKCPNIDVNVPCFDGCYPIHTAVQSPRVLEKLLTIENINLNVTASYEMITPLHMAAYADLYSSAEALIKSGAEVNARLDCGLTPMDLAIQRNHQGIMDLLKNAGGISMVQKENRIWLPWAVAVEIGPGPMTSKMSNVECLNALLIGGSTALHHAVIQGNIESCKLLLFNGANVNQQDQLGRTPLHFAAAMDKKDIAKLLLEHHAQINIQTSIGFTAIHKAAMLGHTSTIHFLISQGADVYLKDKKQGNALFPAIAHGNPDTVRLLLESGLDPNSKARQGSYTISAMHLACSTKNGIAGVIKELIKAGADVNERILCGGRLVLCCHTEWTPLHTLVKNKSGYYEAFRVLVEAGSFIDAVTTYPEDGPIRYQDLVPFGPTRDPLSFIADKATADFRSKTMELFKAVRKNDLELTNKLYLEGATVNCCSQKYDTPLVYASWKGYTSMVESLLAKGANVNMSCPLHYAAKFNHKDIVVKLLRHGVDVKKLDSGKSALEIAQENGNLAVALLLKLVENWLEFSQESYLKPLPYFKSCQPLKEILEQLEGEISEEDLCALFKSC